MKERLQDCQRRQTFYEWDVEEIDEHGDVLDHDQNDDLHALLATYGAELNSSIGKHYLLVLIRDSGTEADGLDDRQWAYAKRADDDSLLTLPSHFDGGNIVPKKYHAQLARAQAAILKGE